MESKKKVWIISLAYMWGFNKCSIVCFFVFGCVQDSFFLLQWDITAGGRHKQFIRSFSFKQRVWRRKKLGKLRSTKPSPPDYMRQARLPCLGIKSFLFGSKGPHHKRALMTTSYKPVYGNGFCSQIEEFQKCFSGELRLLWEKKMGGWRNHIYKIRSGAKWKEMNMNNGLCLFFFSPGLTLFKATESNVVISCPMSPTLREKPQSYFNSSFELTINCSSVIGDIQSRMFRT